MDITAASVRALVQRSHPAPVTTVYLNVDGARYPRPADYLARLDALLRDLKRDHGETVEADAKAIRRFVADDVDRSGIRGVGVFASGGAVIDSVTSALGLRNIAHRGERPYVVPLEALLGRSHHIFLALIDRDESRLFSYQLGQVVEHEPIRSDVHGQHEQGGWSQANYQRSIAHDVQAHLKATATRVRELHEDRSIDALVVGGPDAGAKEFSKLLHPYLVERLRDEPLAMADTVSIDDVAKQLAEIEQELVSARRRELLERLAAASGQAGRAARGIRHVVEAANAKSIEVLFAVEGAGAPGWRSETGALALRRDEAEAYGGPASEVDDLIDLVIEEAVRSGAHLEFFRDDERLDGDPVAALLRF